MSILRRLAAPLMLLCAAASTPTFAGQQHIVQPSQLAATIEQHLSAEDADRSAVREALARPEVVTPRGMAVPVVVAAEGTVLPSAERAARVARWAAAVVVVAPVPRPAAQAAPEVQGRSSSTPGN